jgi:hypothetical protein
MRRGATTTTPIAGLEADLRRTNGRLLVHTAWAIGALARLRVRPATLCMREAGGPGEAGDMLRTDDPHQHATATLVSAGFVERR